GLVSTIRALLSLHHEVLPSPTRPWARNRSEGPRRTTVSATAPDGVSVEVSLQQAPESSRRVPSALAGRRGAGLFLVSLSEREDLRRLASRNEPIDVLAARWH